MNKLLGWVAALGQLRKQAIPPHILLLFLCLSGFTWGLSNYLESSANGGKPESLTQVQFLERGAQQSYVEITGTVLADGQIPGEGKTLYFPLLEESSKVVTYVRVPESATQPQAGVTYRISGLISFVDADLEQRLPKDQAGMRFNRNQYVHYGQQPANPRWAVAGMLVSLLLSWPLLVTWFGHYIVFQSQALPDNRTPAASLGEVRFSGRCTRGKKEKRRFLEAPVKLTLTEEGWLLELPEDWQACFQDPKNIRAGTLFLGSQERPALRFDALEKTRGHRATFVLTFEGDSQRLLAFTQLTTSGAAKP